MPIKPFLIHDFDLKGKRATVLGLGRFGGGIAAVEYLSRWGASITVIDSQNEEALSESIKQLSIYPDIAYELGSSPTELPATDLLVLNPAIPPAHPLMKYAQEQCIPVTSEIELFWQLNRGRVIGVTGSNGKSTTAAMIYSILEANGTHCWLGGNIGVSLLPVVDQIQPEDWVVLELSSFQLDALNRIQASPHVGVVTNFSPNHLDWHQTLEHYRQSKQAILCWQTEHDFAVLNADDSDLQSWKRYGNISTFGAIPHLQPDVLMDNDSFMISDPKREFQAELKVPGRHNRMNAAAAISACCCVQIDEASIQTGLEAFQGLPHRLQFVGEFQNRRFYNDSLATTPESAICAINAFSQVPVILLAGGSDKKVDLTKFAKTILNQTKATALMGETGSALDHLLENLKPAESQVASALISHPHKSFQEAFDWAFQHSEPGDVILLSPGCASYDWFSSFVERGERFSELVQFLSDRK